MLRIRVSNRYEQLAETLISALAGTRRSPIAAPLVIIPNAAVRSDLMQRLSRKTGIAANLRFEFLGRWLWMLLPDLVPGVAARPPFEIDELTWRCFDKLGKMAPASQPPVLQPYLRDADELRLIELAASAAQLIRNYGTHRPEWLSQWQAGKPVAALAGHAHEAWQAALWRTLSVELGMATEHPMVAYRRKLLAASQKELAQLHLPSQVSVFCVDELSDLALGMLDALARHVDVTLYTINPSEAYWFDTVSPRRLARLRALGKADHHESAHPLLTTLAPQTQVRLAKLLALDGEHVEDEFDVVSPRANDLLAAIQDSMLQLDDPPAGAWSGIDRTPLEIHACHSLTRELEVLHDRLLALFAARPGLRPEDVAVFVPDTDSAAPLIDAVFGTPRATPDLPYRIAGRKTIHADQATKALLLALDLGQRPWTVNAALDLLAEPIVHRRLGMDDVDLARLTDWLAASGAHAGLDVIDADPAHTGAHPTLTSALERLVLGFAVPDRATDPLDRISPVAGVEGSDAQLLASWARHLDTLEQISVLGRSRWPIERWQELISALAERTLSDAPEFAEDRLTLQTRLAAATGLLKRCLHDQIVGLAVIIHALKSAVRDTRQSVSASGAITFANLHDLSPLPFHVVAAIGLDDGVVPPRPRALEHDLMRAAPRAGDPLPADDARERFLGLLLSARSHLHLSFTGRSIKDNTPLLPSSLITELLDWLAPKLAPAPCGIAEIAAARRNLIIEHALQPFSRLAYSSTSDIRLRSFDASWLPHSSARREGMPPHIPYGGDGPSSGLDAEDDEVDRGAGDVQGLLFFPSGLPSQPIAPTLQLDVLSRFLDHPSRFLLKQRLRLDTWLESASLEDDGPTGAEVLKDTQLQQWALDQLLDGRAADAVAASLALRPGMPWGSQAPLAAEAVVGGLRPLSTRILAARTQAPVEQDVSLLLETSRGMVRLLGTLRGLHAGRLVGWQVRPPSARDELRWWLQHLVLSATRAALPARPDGASQDQHPATTEVLHPAGSLRLRHCDEAQERLTELLDIFFEGQDAPLPFFPRTSRALAAGETARTVMQIWAGTHERPGERDDPSNALAFRGHPDPLNERAETMAARIWRPYFEHLLPEDARP